MINTIVVKTKLDLINTYPLISKDSQNLFISKDFKFSTLEFCPIKVDYDRKIALIKYRPDVLFGISSIKIYNKLPKVFIAEVFVYKGVEIDFEPMTDSKLSNTIYLMLKLTSSTYLKINAVSFELWRTSNEKPMFDLTPENAMNFKVLKSTDDFIEVKFTYNKRIILPAGKPKLTNFVDFDGIPMATLICYPSKEKVTIDLGANLTKVLIDNEDYIYLNCKSTIE